MDTGQVETIQKKMHNCYNLSKINLIVIYFYSNFFIIDQ